MARKNKVLIVGASTSGVMVAEAIRENDASLDVHLISAEESEPYDRPPLSKELISESQFQPRDTLIHCTSWYKENALKLSLRQRALALDSHNRRILLDDGSSESADDIVIATGCRPRVLPGFPPGAKIIYFRTLQDATRLRHTLRQGVGHLIIVGGGFIGLETASTAAALGWNVSVLEGSESPLGQILPALASEVVTTILECQGIDFYTRTVAQSQVTCNGQVTITTNQGQCSPADLVVVGAGIRLNTEWLSQSGVRRDSRDAVRCDASGRTSVSGVWAVGDAACWHNVQTGTPIYAAHWRTAKDHGYITGSCLAGNHQEWEQLPYFWSDLARKKLQIVGTVTPSLHCSVRHDRDRVVCVLGDHALRAVMGLSHPRAVALGQKLLTAHASMEEARNWLATV